MIPFFNIDGDCPFAGQQPFDAVHIINQMETIGYDVDLLNKKQVYKIMDAYGILRYGQRIVKEGNIKDGVTEIIIPKA